MLPTEKAENCIVKYPNGKVSWTDQFHTKSFRDAANVIAVHLYVLSDGKIEVGDWYILIPEDQIKQASQDIIPHRDFKKIVATSDKSIVIEGKCWCMKPEAGGCSQCNKFLPQLPESFIKAYIEAYNDNRQITEVDLEIELNQCDGCQRGIPVIDGIHKDDQAFGIGCTRHLYNKIKTRPDNTVIVHESRKYSRDQVIDFIEEYSIYQYKMGDNINIEEWISENL